MKFSDLDMMPMNLRIERLDSGQGIENTLSANGASWHRTCFSNFNDLKLQRAQKRKSDINAESVSPVKTRASTSGITKPELTASLCFFYDHPGGILHRAATKDLNETVHNCAVQLCDTRLLAKLAMEDMHAQDAYYHNRCMVAIYNRARSAEKKDIEESAKASAESIALAELVSYIEETRMEMEVATVFKLSDLVKLYQCRLQQLDEQVPDRVNSTQLKERLLSQMPDLKAYKEGKEVLIAFEMDVGAVLLTALEQNDSNAMILAKAAQIVRKDMLQKENVFNGSFNTDRQLEAVPESLGTLVNMILNGSNVKVQTNQEMAGASSSAVSVISQLLIFNVVKHGRSTSSTLRHSTERETPLAIYLALLIHAQTRKRDLIDRLYRLGLCISYDRVIQISADMGNSVCALYESEKLVCPAKLRKGLLTTGNVDNIDHNPSARTAKDSFHGTAVSLTQHPSHDSPGIAQEVVVINPNIPKRKGVGDLPEGYTNILPVAISAEDLHAPAVNSQVKASTDLISSSKQSECEWLE